MWGGELGRASNRQGTMVQRGSLTLYKLSGIASSLSGSTMFCQTLHGVTIQMRLDNATAVTYIKKLGETHSLPLLSPCSNHMGLKYTKKHLSTGGTLAREGEPSGRSGIKINEGSLQLDAESSGIQPNPAPGRATIDRPVCFPINKAATTILQLEAGPRGLRDRCFQSGLVSNEGVC